MTRPQIKYLLDSMADLDEFKEEHLIKAILEEVVDIDESKIDMHKSKIIFEDNFQLDLISKMNDSCNIYFDVSEPNMVNIQLGKGGEYVFNQRHADFSDLYKLKHAIKDILDNGITEELIIAKNRTIKADYKVTHVIDDVITYHHYSIILGSSFGFSKKKVQCKNYIAWRDKC